VEQRSSVDLLQSCKFFPSFVLDPEMEWIKIIRHLRVHSLPDIPTREEVHRLINRCRKLRYRILFSAGDLTAWACASVKVLGLGKCPTIDGYSGRGALIRGWQRAAQRSLRSDAGVGRWKHCDRFWTDSPHPRCLFPSPGRQPFIVRIAVHRWMPAAWQAALKAARPECGIEGRGFTVHSLRARLRHDLLGREWDLGASIQSLLGHSHSNTHSPLTPTSTKVVRESHRRMH